MRVLILLNTGGVAGGHVVQATKTAEALQAAGVDATLSEDPHEATKGFDVVHAFAAAREVLRQARSSGSCVAISPIWVSADYAYPAARNAVARRTRTLERVVRITRSALWRGVDQTARRLTDPLKQKALFFELADVLLPNSQLEAQQIRADLDVTTPMHIVPNAIDERTFSPPPPDAVRSGVACVGRIEPHKNQLGLIRALKGSGIPLTIAGPEHPDHGAYAERCRRAADGSVTFLGGGDQDAIRDVYRRAAVHALPSWFETTGLASLEAAACDCAVVTTGRGYAREYFGDQALYCDPANEHSILDAVRAALVRGPSSALRNEILERCTWAHAAAATRAGYGLALQGRLADGRP